MSDLREATPASRFQPGYVDLHGYSAALDGYIIGGWIDFSWDDPVDLAPVTLELDTDRVVGEGTLCLYKRADVADKGMGFVLFVAAERPRTGELAAVLLASGERTYRLPLASMAQPLAEDKLFAHVKQFLNNAVPNEARSRLRKLVNRPHFTGTNTVAQAKWPIHFEIDQAYYCPPRSLLLSGWMLDPFNQITRVKVHCGRAGYAMKRENWIAIRRRDVADSFAPKYGSLDDNCGYLTYIHDIYIPGSDIYLEIELKDGDVVFRPIPHSFNTGLSAAKSVLGSFDLRRDAMVQAFDHVIGPAVERINTFRLAAPVNPEVSHFGPRPPEPRCSIVIPLYGRIDFLEYQLAFFSTTLAADHEIIYVLDDPERKSATTALAASSYARFKRPFTLITYPQNLGYAPANNVGLKEARGTFTCYLNSDVFPDVPDWLEYLLETAALDRVGMAGGYLIYEDGTLQHDGIVFERLPEFGNWIFPNHLRKGRRVTPPDGLIEVKAVTGACMVLRTALARDLGGFDEGYVIGDFEDVDLCLKIADMGLDCVVDPRARLFHLERQSQGSSGHSWRMNLTLYNAWRFQNRWGDHDLA